MGIKVNSFFSFPQKVEEGGGIFSRERFFSQRLGFFFSGGWGCRGPNTPWLFLVRGGGRGVFFLGGLGGGRALVWPFFVSASLGSLCLVVAYNRGFFRPPGGGEGGTFIPGDGERGGICIPRVFLEGVFSGEEWGGGWTGGGVFFSTGAVGRGGPLGFAYCFFFFFPGVIGQKKKKNKFLVFGGAGEKKNHV